MTPRPKSTKKKHLLAIEPEVMAELKALALEYEKPIGEIIEGLVDFASSARYVTDETYSKRFNSILSMCLMNAGVHGGWVMPATGETDMEYIRRKTREELEAKKRELDEELRRLNSEE